MRVVGRERGRVSGAAIPGPHALPTCDFCGDDFLNPMRGYRHGCEKHDPAIRERQRRETLLKHYQIARSVIRRSHGQDVETALLALDDIYAEATRP